MKERACKVTDSNQKVAKERRIVEEGVRRNAQEGKYQKSSREIKEESWVL